MIEELIEEIRRRELSFSFSIQYRADTGCDEALLRSLKEVGLRTVFIGVESGVESVLQRFDKGIRRTDIDDALRIVHELGFNLIPGYMLYNPDTEFGELQKSVEYLLQPDSPLIQDLHGMNLLKGTAEEFSLRQRDLVRVRGFAISYRMADERVAAYARWQSRYYQLYRPVVLDVYEILFLLVDLPEAIAAEMKQIEPKIRNLHERFLTRTMDGLARHGPEVEIPLDDLGAEYRTLAANTRQLVEQARAVVGSTFGSNGGSQP